MTPWSAPGLRAGRLEGAAPAAIVLAVGLAVVLLRPPLPIDEIRYLQVFHESLRGSPLLLHLQGEPYAEKPPFLFWLARALTLLALPPDMALRCVSPLAAAGTVWMVARIGQRIGLALAGWTQAALLIPLAGGHLLHFDPLLTLSIWAALEAWLRRADVGFVGWTAIALLTKGPVAWLFLLPFLWSLAPLRSGPPREGRRLALCLALAIAPLVAWALAAASLGGPEFARALLWERWAGRVAGGAPHSRSFFFYLPLILVGSLPATWFLFTRAGALDRGAGRRWSRRLARSLLALLVTFTLIRGKQAQYVEPAVPALVLWLAWKIESRPGELRRLRRGVGLQLGGLFLAALAGLFGIEHLLTGPRGRALLDMDGTLVPLALMGGAALLAFLVARRVGTSARGLLAVALLGTGASLLPFHWLAGQFLFPHALREAVRSETGEIAFLGSSRHGTYAWIAGERRLEKQANLAALSRWGALHPSGLAVVDASALQERIPTGWELVTDDVVHRTPILLLRAVGPDESSMHEK